MNVCESCIVKDHQRCIIKSYVQWLQDSDYNPICLLCMESVEHGEVVRLACYDLFHWECFNKWALENHGETTPTSKYLCPDCKSPVFPPKALVSPVADVIRAKFATVGWGRRCLGLAPEPSQATKPKVVNQLSSSPTVEIRPIAESTPKPEQKSTGSDVPIKPATVAPTLKPKHQPPKVTEFKQVKAPTEEFTPRKTSPLQKPVSNVVTYTRDKYPTEVASASTPHKVIDSRRYDDAKINVTHDIDDNKYKRKGITHWVGNLLSLNKDKKTTKGLTFRKVTIALVIFTMIFLTILYIVSTYGRNFAAYDPMLDPMKNPNIKVADMDPADGDTGGVAAAAAGII